jgi:hypothetical protein
MRRLFCGLVAVAIVVACSDLSSPPPNQAAPVPNSQLHIVLQSSSAPPLLVDSASFYAVMGQDREVRMYYQGAAPGVTGQEFLRLKVPGDGLLSRPDGSLFQPGDSILIIIKVVDPKKLLFDFQPTGLHFSPDHPAELTLEYLYSNHDFNGDGVIDTADARIKGALDIWQRQPSDTLWYRLQAANYESYEELDGKILHFTEHAIAW